MSAIRPWHVLTVGLVMGCMGATAQVLLLRANPIEAGPLHGMVTFTLAIVVGTFAGLVAKREALKAAGLAGVVAGSLNSSVGLTLLLRNPNAIGLNPLASAESALSFVSSVLGGTLISSWIIAGIAMLVALPISEALISESRNS